MARELEGVVLAQVSQLEESIPVFSMRVWLILHYQRVHAALRTTIEDSR
jgi:hypothetical protein